MISVSIIICTCNRSASLKQTLEALENVRIPSDWKAEVILVDNASTDDTAKVVRNTKLSKIPLRYLYEPKKGQSNARNTGLAHATGEFILFTDDDVIPAEDWAEQMVTPLVLDKCDAVTGQITLAPHLMRSWLSPMHRWWLAHSHDAKYRNGVRELIGCNTGFRRAVLERVPAFDPELGPGALGFGDDGLFGWQIAEAGFRIEYAPKARVIHQIEPFRLLRSNWLDAARKRGRSEAYLLYHWYHSYLRFPRLKWIIYFLKLHLRRILQPPPGYNSEGCPLWEMSYLLDMEKCIQFCRERKRPRNYLRQGLKKIALE